MNKSEKRQLKLLQMADRGVTDKELEIIETVQELEDSIEEKVGELDLKLTEKIDSLSEE